MLITDGSNRPTLSSKQNCSSVVQSSGSKSITSHTSLASTGKKQGQVPHLKHHKSSQKVLTSHHTPSKIPLRRPTVNHSVVINKMPAAKGNSAGQPVLHKQPVFLPHKQNLSNPRAMSPIVPMSGPRSLMVNNIAYTKNGESAIMSGNYELSGFQQHHSYMSNNNNNSHNVFKSGNGNSRGATVINSSGIPLYRQASTTSLITTNTQQNGNNWKMGISSANPSYEKNGYHSGHQSQFEHPHSNGNRDNDKLQDNN